MPTTVTARAVVGTQRITPKIYHRGGVMYKTRSTAAAVWISLIWLIVEAYLGQLLMMKTRRVLLFIIVNLQQVLP